MKTADETEKVINTYKSINYTREWFDTHKYRYKFGQDFNPYIGEYFLVDLYAGEICQYVKYLTQKK